MRTDTQIPDMTDEELRILYSRIERNHARVEEYQLLDQFLSAIGYGDYLQRKLKRYGIYDYAELIERRKKGYESETNRMTGAALGIVDVFQNYKDKSRNTNNTSPPAA
jgi:hypothetical protein